MVRRKLKPSQSGSTLVIALLTVMVIAMVTGHILLRITSQLETAHRSSAWNEALSTAESAVDMTVADLTALLPDVRLNSDEGLAIGVSALPTHLITSLNVSSTGVGLQPGLSLSFSPAPLLHGGEGAGRQEATVILDVLPLSQLLGTGGLQLDNVAGLLSNPLDSITGGDLKLVRLRARGTIGVPSRRADRESLDAQLRRTTLVWDRVNGQRAARASVSREVEVVLKPVFPFQSAVTTVGRFDSPASSVVFDSFNSLLPTASTNGRYDGSKRLSNGDVHAGSSQVDLKGTVYGDVRTSGASVEKTSRITGSVDNSYYQPLPLIRTPTWTRTPLSPSQINGNSTLPASTVPGLARYKFNHVKGSLRISGTPLGLPTQVDIWVTGDVTGSITLDPGVTARLYVEGDVVLDTNDLVNNSQRAANLQIFGLPDESGSSTPREIRLELGDVYAAIYAPTHKVTLTGNGHFQGAITASSFETEGNAKVHFDEALALNVGPMLRYEIASWTERPL